MAKSSGKSTKNIKRIAKFVLHACTIPAIVLLVACTLLLSYHLIFWGKIYPGIKVGEYYLGGKTEREAIEILHNIETPRTILVSSPSQEFTIESLKLDLKYDALETAKSAYFIGRSTKFTENVINKWRGLVSEVEISRSFSFNQVKLKEFTDQISETLFIASIKPGVVIQKTQVIVERGRPGQEVNVELLNQLIFEELKQGRGKVIVPFKSPEQNLTDAQVYELEKRGEKILGKSITLNIDSDSNNVADSQIVLLLAPDGKYYEPKLIALVEKIAGQFNRPVQEAMFKFEGGRVLEFKPAKSGIEVEKDKLKIGLLTAITDLENNDRKKVEIAIPVLKQEAKTKTGDVNDLGIKELIGKGTSRFRGSIPSRVHNIGIAASRINGILIAPGETFSFNRALGDVSAFTGYQQAYIIKDGKTILGDGGGVCQVSTTLFRAVLASGLPIVERRAHSYRVSYYEQDAGVGLDATVYDPTTDLKIKNDTPAHILIQTGVDKKNLTLTFELYGTSDGRVATTTKSKVWDQVEPPEDLYQDDPSLPTGTVKQVDFKAWGAKASFDYSVVRGNEQLQKRTFYSAYRPWQAIFLRGTAPQ